MAAEGWLRSLQRRKLVQWSLGYAAAAWIVLQVLDLVAGVYAWPAVVLRLATGIAAVGLFVVVVLAWFHGERGQQRAGRAEILVLALIVAAGSAAIWRIERQSAPGAGPAVLGGAVADKSVAVLPFEDLSPGRDDGWFADGLTEEIINGLSRLPELLVTARTSAFRFRDTTHSIPDIAAQLGVAHVVEGSVRRAGERLRVTAQLIRAHDGFNLWSQTYDRPAADVFAVQQDIAQGVARMLDVYLDDARRAAMFTSGTRDPEAYAEFLRGVAVYLEAHNSGLDALWDANRSFARALALDPGYAVAEFLQHDVYGHLVWGDLSVHGDLHRADGSPDLDEAGRRMHAHLDRARDLASDPQLVATFAVARAYLVGEWQALPGAIDRLESETPNALVLDAGAWLPNALAIAGRHETLARIAARHLQRSPLDPQAWSSAMLADRLAGRYEAALERAAAAQAAGLHHAYILREQVFSLYGLGRHAEALAALEAAEGRDAMQFGWPGALRTLTLAMLGRHDEARARLPALAERRNRMDVRCWILAELGQQAEADAVAAELDALPGGLGSIRLANVTRFAGAAPFELAATPVFASRLAAMGTSPPRYVPHSRPASTGSTTPP